MIKERMFRDDPMNWFRTGSDRYSPYHWRQMELQARLAGTLLSEYGLLGGGNDSICVVGFGFGRDSIFIHDQLLRSNEVPPRIIGLDINFGRLIEGREDTKAQGARADLIQGSMNHTPFPNDAFLATICLDTLVHADNLRQTMMELKRVTRPDGLIICNIPTSHTLPVDLLKALLVEGFPRTISLIREKRKGPKGFSARTTYYLPWEIERVISDCDLETVEKETFAHGLYTFLVLQK